MPNWARHAIAHTKHISTCSGAPWHAVIEPRRMARVSSVRSIETLGEKTNEKRAQPESHARCIYWRRAMARRYNCNAI